MHTVEFPGLGLVLHINPIALKIFGIPIYWYGIIIAVGFLVAVLLGMRDSQKFGIDSETIIDLVLFAAPTAIVFARLYYVVFSWNSYKNNLWEIINIRHGGLAIYGGVVGAFLMAYLVSKYKKISALKLFDFGVPYLVLAQAIGRWGNFINQEAFGTNTTLPWGMKSEATTSYLKDLQSRGINVDPGAPVHPAFLYESLWNLGVFFLLIWYRKRKKRDGEVFFLYMILYGVGRFWIESLRTDSLMAGNLRISMVLAALFVVGFSILFLVKRRNVQLAGSGDSGYGELKPDNILGFSEEHVENEVNASEDPKEKSPVTEEDNNLNHRGDDSKDKLY